MPRKISLKTLKTFLFSRFSKKFHFQCVFDDNLSVSPVFIKQIFRVPEEAPPCPLPTTGLCSVNSVQGVGEKWIFSSSSRSFGSGYEAVRIRVKEPKCRIYQDRKESGQD
jgi:hypothetical protein